MDSRWNAAGGDGIVLAPLDAGPPYPTAPAPVVAGSTTLNGTPQSGHIRFRIGLQKSYTATNTYPARYAVVVIFLYNEQITRVHKLYLRQGEGADYLMRPTDPVNGGEMVNGSLRPLASKFSPYNLTVPDNLLTSWTGGSNLTGHPVMFGRSTDCYSHCFHYRYFKT
jgi:hypothetical protein